MKYLQPCLWALIVLWQIKTIRLRHRVRLYVKSVKLFLSFLAFTDRERPPEQLRQAMMGAELSAVYDLDTDQKPVRQLEDSTYLVHLRQLVSNRRVRRPARRLFIRDLEGRQSVDGLERGSVALTFYNAIINSRWLRVYSAGEISHSGRCLQILDDALDLVKDRVNGDKNSLLGERRHLHLAEGTRFMRSAFFGRLAENSWIYRRYFPRKWAEVHDGLRIHRKDSAMMTSGRNGRPFDARAASDVMEEVKAHMLATRPEKYKPWFRGIETFRSIATTAERVSFVLPGLAYFEDGKRRAEGIDAVYRAAHAADDVADGDAAVPPGFVSAMDYIDHLTRVVAGYEEPREAIGRLYLYGLALLRETGADLQQEMLDILAVLRFDAERRSKGILVACSREELELCVDKRDIDGTIGGCLKATREDRVTISDIAPLGVATQIRYTIRDLRSDVLKCMLNIPREDVAKFGTYIPDHTSEAAVREWSDSLPVRRWCVEQAEQGQHLLRKYRARKSELNMHPYTRAVLGFMYEAKARSYLGRVARAA